MARGYKVVFTGQLAEGVSKRNVKEQLVTRFKLDNAKIDLFFSGEPRVVKVCDDPEKAGHYQAALASIGLVCSVIELKDSPRDALRKPPPASWDSRKHAKPTQVAPPDPPVPITDSAFSQERSPAPEEPPPTMVREQRVIEVHQTEGMTNRQIMGLAGSLILLAGVFAPILSIPIAGQLNYFRNGTGDGVFVLIMAIISLVVTLTKKYGLLWATGLGSLAVMVFTFVHFHLTMSGVKADLDVDLADNPFRGLADMAVQSIQLQWGWGVLLVGVLLLLITAGSKGN